MNAITSMRSFHDVTKDSFILKLGSHLIDMDAGLGERIRDFFAIATVRGQDGVYCAMFT